MHNFYRFLVTPITITIAICILPFLSNAQNVGIGTATPEAKLQIMERMEIGSAPGDEDNYAFLSARNPAHRHNYIVTHASQFNTWNQWIRYAWDGNNNTNRNTWRIGTYDEGWQSGKSIWRVEAKNAATDKNYIVAGPRAGSSANVDGTVLYNAYFRAGNNTNWQGDGATGAYTSTGLGIGTTSPSSKLEVQGGNAIISDNSSPSNYGEDGLTIDVDDHAHAGNPVGLWLEGDDVSEIGLRFKANGNNYYQNLYDGNAVKWRSYNGSYTTRMALTDNGRLGIGTTSPSADLHVIGSMKASSGTSINEFSVDGNLAGNSDNALPTEQAVKEYVDNQVSGNDDWDKSGSDISNNNSGQVSIGTTSGNAKFNVVGNATIADNGSPNNFGEGLTVDVNSHKKSGNPIGLWLEGDDVNEIGLRYHANGSNYYQSVYDGNSVQWRHYNGTNYIPKMTLTNAGHLGIGTTSPDNNLLHINAGSGKSSMFFTVNGDNSNAASVGIDANDGHKFKISDSYNIGSSNWLTIEQNGQVGIGTTSPTADLHVDGTIKALSSGSGTSVNEFSTDGTMGGNSDNAVPTEQAVKEYVDGQVSGNDDWDKSGTDISNNNSGQVSIGTTSGKGKFNVQGNATIADNGTPNNFGEGLTVDVNSHNSSGNPIGLWLEGDDVNEIGLRYHADGGNYYQSVYNGNSLQWRHYNGSNYVARMALTNQGRLGMGTTSPTEDIHIDKTSGHNAIRVGEASYVQESDNIKRLFLGANVYDDESNSWTRHSSSDGAAAVDLVANDGGYGTYMRFNVDATSSGFPKERMRITSDGDVGVGLSSPSYKLHVNGRIKSDGITETSDKRLKKDIKQLQDAVSKVEQLNGVYYKWKRNEYPDKHFEKDQQVGVLAQEVEKILPALVDTGREGYKSVEYSHLVPLLIEGMKEQQAVIDQYKKKVDKLEKKNASLEAEVEAIKEHVGMQDDDVNAKASQKPAD